jgi:hypothetical protein
VGQSYIPGRSLEPGPPRPGAGHSTYGWSSGPISYPARSRYADQAHGGQHFGVGAKFEFEQPAAGRLVTLDGF